MSSFLGYQHIFGNSFQKGGAGHRLFGYMKTMANEQNLKGYGFHERTASEQREIAKQGGKASGEARREKKLIRDRILERMGEADWDAYIDGIIERAKESKADAEFLRDTIGEKPVDKQEIAVTDDSSREMYEYFKRTSNNPAEE